MINRDTEQFTNLVDIRVENHNETSPLTVEYAKKGIAIVLANESPNNSGVDLFFVSPIIGPRGETQVSGAYDPETNAIFVNRNSPMYGQFLALGFSDAQAGLLIAAHEAAHKAQIDRGEEVSPSVDKDLLDSAYVDDVHEVEAWETAIHAYMYYFPSANGHINVSGRRYDFPEKSKYSL